MLDWKQKSYPKNTPVKVVFTGKKRILNGTLLTPYDCRKVNNQMPKIKLTSGKIIFGYDCWWIPVNETKDAQLL